MSPQYENIKNIITTIYEAYTSVEDK